MLILSGGRQEAWRLDGILGIGELASATQIVPPDKIGHAEYVRKLREELPPEAFRPNPYAYVPIVINFAIVIGGWIAIHYTGPKWAPLFGLIIGNSMAALAFLAHDVFHRSVTTNRYLLYPTEVALWGIMFLPATLWRRLHAAHHAHTNSDKDPDRRFLADELTPAGLVTAATMFPNRYLRYTFTYLLYWVVFPFRHGIVAFLYPDREYPSYVTNKPRYSRQDKIRLVGEFVLIVALQLFLAWFLRGGYFWGAIVPVIITSAVVSWYFFTNHGLKPVDDGDDILAATTTVTVPELCNKLHSNFSYHTEHHLFPNMNPKYYPLVSELFRKHYPDRYHCIPIVEAWSGLWRNAIATPRRGDPPEPAADHKRASADVAANTGERPSRVPVTIQS